MFNDDEVAIVTKVYKKLTHAVSFFDGNNFFQVVGSKVGTTVQLSLPPLQLPALVKRSTFWCEKNQPEMENVWKMPGFVEVDLHMFR